MIKYRKYERCLSKGLLRAMTAAATFLAAPASDAGKASNSFLTVEGEGVSVAADGSVCVDAGASGPVTVTARPGWLVNGRESLTFPKATGAFRGLKVTSRLGEDSEHVHKFTCTVEDREHLEDIVLGATADHPDEIAMYALPATSAVVTASATSRIVKKGKHRTVTTWKPCDCGAVHDPPVEFGTREVVPDYYEWESEAAGKAVPSNVWSGPMSKGLDQEVSFAVVGRRHVCEECTCSNSVVAHVDVHELSVERPDYLGLDRTDAGLSNWAVTNATARIDPAPASATYNWTKCGKCRFVGTTNKLKVSYGIANSSTASERFLAEDLKVTATASNADGLSASATCTTNFTVVKVDVQIGTVGENKEETEGAFVQYVPDTNGVIGVEGTNKMVEVKFTCNPTNLPANEMVTVLHTGQGELYEVLQSGELLKVTSATYPACEIASRKFKLHGHAASATLTNGAITIEHANSGAKDLAKYTDVKLRVTNIKFNHDTSSSYRDAINIRRSYAEEIDVSNGEWFEKKAGTIISEPFCYTTNRAVTVKARFEASSFITSAVIRATCAGAGGSLSSLIPTNVVFVGGISSPEYVEFAMVSNTLPAIDCSKGGVLGWQASEINGGIDVPCEMNASGPHIVYTILGEPKSPWKNVYGEKENAWTNALEFAIVKAAAAGKSTDKDALAAITTHLHSGHGLTYDTVEGAPRYWDPATRVFSATAYINVSNSASVTNFVNCYDQAYGVVTFGNLLGPVVNAVPRFTKPFGYINTTKLVGVGDCNNPFYDSTNEWQYVHITGTGSVSIGSGKPPKDPVCNVDDNTRTWFGNHMYATYHVVGDDYVFDACAGPYTGGISKTNYLNNAIDHSTIDERELSFHGGTIINLPKKDEDKPIDFPIN